MSALKVLIIGAGFGGRTLAQTLRRDGLGVDLFERDQGPFDRPQGCRLHLDAGAINAANEVLTPALHDVFVAMSQWTQPHTTLLGRDLSVTKRMPTHHDHGEGVWPR